MMSLTFGLFTQVSDSGPQGPLVHRNIKDNVLITYMKYIYEVFMKIAWQLWLPWQPFMKNFK